MVVMRHEANVRGETYKLSVVIPCYNEMATLERCVASVMSIARDNFTLEIIIVDDCSTDDSLSIANTLAARHQAQSHLQQTDEFSCSITLLP